MDFVPLEEVNASGVVIVIISGSDEREGGWMDVNERSLLNN